MQKFKALSLATLLSLAVTTAQAEFLPEVSEARTRNPAKTAPQMSNNPSSYELVERLQWMQEELQTMRGILEEAQHEIGQMQTRQRDLYADLDERIAEIRQELAGNTINKPKTEPLAVIAPNEMVPEPVARAQLQKSVAAAVSSGSDKDAYQAAYDLLQNQRYAAAIDAFDAYLQDNPDGQYVANAYYWLGESHVIYDDLGSAEVAFKAVVDKYPLHQKAPDAMLKLGYVYDAAGEKDKAVATLTQVKQKYPNSSVSRLADQRIVQIKQSM